MKWIKKNLGVIILPLLFVLILVFQDKSIMNDYALQLVLLSGINIIMVQALNLINGMTGISSLGHAGFMAIGGYISAAITTLLFNMDGWGLAARSAIFVVATLIGGLVAAGFGFLIGLPTLRLKGDYLAIVTLGFCEVIRSILRVFSPFGGALGLAGIPKLGNLFWVFLFVVITVYICRNFMDSVYGRACMAVRDNEIAADTMGINASHYKIVAFVLSAFIAGIAGSMYAHVLCYLHPDVFSYTKSSDFVIYLYAGGVGSISGAILGAVALTGLPEILRFLSSWRLVIYGALLVVIILFRPVGLFGGKEFAFLKLNTGGIINVNFSNLFTRKKKTVAAHEEAKK